MVYVVTGCWTFFFSFLIFFFRLEPILVWFLPDMGSIMFSRHKEKEEKKKGFLMTASFSNVFKILFHNSFTQRRKLSLFHTIWRLSLIAAVFQLLRRIYMPLEHSLKVQTTNVWLSNVIKRKKGHNFVEWGHFWRCKWTNMVKDLSGCSCCCSERM